MFAVSFEADECNSTKQANMTKEVGCRVMDNNDGLDVIVINYVTRSVTIAR